MVTRAVLRYVRISPRKFRLIIPIVKGKNPEDAVIILKTVKKGASKIAIDLINSAIANAKRIQGVDVGNLYISNLIANCGPQLKRFRAASMGRASPIIKRTSHIIVELDTVAAPERVAQAKAEPAAKETPRPKKSAAAKGVAEQTDALPAKDAKKPKGKTAAKTDTRKGKE